MDKKHDIEIDRFLPANDTGVGDARRGTRADGRDTGGIVGGNRGAAKSDTEMPVVVGVNKVAHPGSERGFGEIDNRNMAD